MKRIFTTSVALVLAACSSHLPAPGRSIAGAAYVQPADTNASMATLTVETSEPVTLLTVQAYDDAAQFDCAGFAQGQWAQTSQAAIQDNNGATIAGYATLHLMPNEVKVEGDRVVPADNQQEWAKAYTDDGHKGAVCAFELDKVHVLTSP